MIERPRLEELPGAYIVKILEEAGKNGQAYLPQDKLLDMVLQNNMFISNQKFLHHRAELFRYGYLAMEGQRIYLPYQLGYENTSATALAKIFLDNDLPSPKLPKKIWARKFFLNEDQKNGVAMALSHRISMILGGAGTGKSALISGILSENKCYSLVCAPTGKAAITLSEKLGKPVLTVHGALGKIPEQNFLSRVRWGELQLIVVDEASMITIEMLAGILSVMNETCKLVLVGDPQQLQSVGAGNVLQDLLKLGFPSHTLQVGHRQNVDAVALSYNVQNFKNIHSIADLQWDDSFQIYENTNIPAAMKSVCQFGAASYLRKENIQVLAPFNQSCKAINTEIQKITNRNPVIPNSQFRHQDRVMVVKNDKDRCVYNGEIFNLNVNKTDSISNNYTYTVRTKFGRKVEWITQNSNALPLSLAYAITIHKSQASEWDVIMIPLEKHSPIFTRNLIYTAISRAKTKVIFFGNPDVLEQALVKNPDERFSKLVVKTRQIIKLKVA